MLSRSAGSIGPGKNTIDGIHPKHIPIFQLSKTLWVLGSDLRFAKCVPGVARLLSDIRANVAKSLILRFAKLSTSSSRTVCWFERVLGLCC